MDFSFIKQNDDFVLKEEFFDDKISKCAPEMLGENWSSSTDDILDSIFPMDFLNNLVDNQIEFCSYNDFNGNMKLETDDYQMSEPIIPDSLLSHENNLISSNSSDSGLSSDNLEVEMSPPYEPLSPAPSDFGKSPRPFKRTPIDITSSEIIQAPSISCKNEHQPKVIVQKVPQVMTLSNTIQKNVTITPHQKQQFPPQSSQQQIISNGKRGNEIKVVKLSPQLFTSSNKKPLTIQVKNSNTGAKIQAKPGTLFLNKAKLTDMKKIVRVQNSNPRSVLIPVSLQDVKELKSFKIVNTTAVRSTPSKSIESGDTNYNLQNKKVEVTNGFKFNNIIKEEVKEESFIENSSDSESIIIEDAYDDEEYVHDPEVPYPKLILTSEERRLLSKEGITLPTHYPLTKHEERELKRIRRKIRNKISAQDSRKRKKEYVDGLEERVKQCTEENQTLMKRIKQLQSQNQNLMSQMKKLQSLLTKGTNKTTQPTTCLMVLLLSLALVAAPNLKLGQNPKEGDLEEAVQDTILQNRRNLLFNNKEANTDVFDEEVNMSDIVSALEFSNERENNAVCKTNTYTSASIEEPKCKKMKLNSLDFIDNVDEDNWYLIKKSQNKNLESVTETTQGNRYQLQTSGFNIEKESTVEEVNGPSWLDKTIFEMITPSVNSFHDLNMEKIATESYGKAPENSVFDVTFDPIYTNQINIKQNLSEMRQIEKY